MIPRELEVLLVEDQPTDAELVLRALWREVPRELTEWVRDGEKALALLTAMAASPNAVLPRVVLLDLKLPRVGGLELAALVRTDAALRDIPLVILSSSADASDIARAYRCGVNSYVVKPVGLDELERTVRELAGYWIRHNRPAR